MCVGAQHVQSYTTQRKRKEEEEARQRRNEREINLSKYIYKLYITIKNKF